MSHELRSIEPVGQDNDEIFSNERHSSLVHGSDEMISTKERFKLERVLRFGAQTIEGCVQLNLLDVNSEPPTAA